MPLGSKRRTRAFDVPIHDMVLRVSGADDLYEEVRATGMQFWEQLQAYGIRHPEFCTSKRPVTVPDDGPAMVREIAETSAAVGVGPMFALQGALTDHVGRLVARTASEIVVSNGGDYFVVTRRRSRLIVHPAADVKSDPLAIVVDPDLGPQGIHTTMGRLTLPAEGADSVVVATSCMLADAAAAAAAGIATRYRKVGPALHHLRSLRGVHGAVVIRGDRIGVVGSLELAA